MNVVSILHLLGFIVDILLIIVVLSRNQGVLLNRLCALFFTSIAAWSLFYFICIEARSGDQALFYLNLASTGWYVAPSAALAFFLSLARKEMLVKNKPFIGVLTGFSLLFIFQQWTGNMSRVATTSWGWAETWQPTFYTHLYYAYLVIVSFAIFYLLFEFFRQSKTVWQKKQATLLMVSFFATAVFAATSNIIFRYLDITALPDIADIAFMGLGVGIVLAVSKYGLMSMTPIMAADEILNTMSDALILLNDKKEIVYANPAALSLLEREHDELNGNNFASIVEDPEKAKSMLDVAFNFNSGTDFELNYLSGKSKTIPMLISASRVYNSKNKLDGYVIIAKDISALKRLENELHSEKDFSKAIIECLPEFFYVMDMEGTLLHWNQNALKVLGYSAEQAINMNVSSVIAPERTDSIKEYISLAYSQGYITRESELIDRNNKRIPCLTTTTMATINDRIYLLGMAIDITERKKAEQAKEKAEKYYKLLADNTSDTVIILGPDLKVQWISESYMRTNNYTLDKLTSLPADRLTNQHSKAIMDDTSKEILRLDKSGTLPDDYIVSIEVEIISKKGLRWSELTFKPIKDAQHKLAGILIQGRDIHKRKLAEDSLQKMIIDFKRSNEELQQFAYIASHDLQEPLRMVSSYVQLLEKRYKDKLDADALDFIEFAVSGARRMQNLINDLLAYSRVGTKGKPFQTVDCSVMLNTVLKNLEMTIKDSGAVINHNELPQVIGDNVQLIQVFQNLIGNAIKFHGGETPQVNIDAQRQNGNWVFSVSDNGIGIEPQYFERIFTVFQKLNGTAYPGTGIGLSIVRKVIYRHGGQIWLESQPGKGTTFYFTVPAKETTEVVNGN